MSSESPYLETILRALPDGIYFKDREGRFTLVNQWMVHRFEAGDVSDFIGKTDFDFFIKEHAQEAFDDEMEIIRTGEPLLDKIEHEMWHDGRESWVSTSKVAWRDEEGNIIGTFGTSRDVTKRILAERKLQQTHEELKQKTSSCSTILKWPRKFKRHSRSKFFPLLQVLSPIPNPF